jgi:hypothetical protein
VQLGLGQAGDETLIVHDGNLALWQAFAKRGLNKEKTMARESMAQRKTAGRMMHEFKHGELKSGRGGKGSKVKSRKQAIAIALKEAGASKYESKRENKRNLAKSKRKEATGRTSQQEREGKRKIGAIRRRESSKSMGGKNAKTTTRRTPKQRAPRAAATSARRSRAAVARPNSRRTAGVPPAS